MVIRFVSIRRVGGYIINVGYSEIDPFILSVQCIECMNQ